MTKTYTITANDTTITYTVRNCTAIPASIGETERVDALYVDYYAESGEHVEHVVFNESMPEDEDDFAAMFDYPSEWDSFYGTLDTVRFPEDEEVETHEIWEDNSGSIYWFVLQNDKAIRCFEGWEHQGAGSIADALHQIAEDPAAYRNWDGDCVERLRNDSLADRQDVTAQELYDEIAGEDQSTLLYGTRQGYNTFNSASWRLFANPEAAQLADVIRDAHDWESCEDECEELCYMAGMGDEWRKADGDTFEGVIERAAYKLHVQI